jgi:hypothetical protein
MCIAPFGQDFCRRHGKDRADTRRRALAQERPQNGVNSRRLAKRCKSETLRACPVGGSERIEQAAGNLVGEGAARLCHAAVERYRRTARSVWLP